MPHKLYQVDAFTDEPFSGNPAAVCLLSGPEPDSWMQALAAEMNLSETAFLLPEGEDWRMRWFTPRTEVDLCGHATLASAKVLFETQPLSRENPIKFQTQSGELRAHWAEGKVIIDFPAMKFIPFTIDPHLDKVLGFHPIEAVVSGDYYLFLAEDEHTIRNVQPDFNALNKSPMPEVIITAESQETKFDFISRFFAPQLGVDEDPVTGSAHCLLAPFWAEKLGKTTLHAFQASKRGGYLHLQLKGERVWITGSAKFIFTAELMV